MWHVRETRAVGREMEGFSFRGGLTSFLEELVFRAGTESLGRRVQEVTAMSMHFLEFSLEFEIRAGLLKNP